MTSAEMLPLAEQRLATVTGSSATTSSCRAPPPCYLIVDHCWEQQLRPPSASCDHPLAAYLNPAEAQQLLLGGHSPAVRLVLDRSEPLLQDAILQRPYDPHLGHHQDQQLPDIDVYLTGAPLSGLRATILSVAGKPAALLVVCRSGALLPNLAEQHGRVQPAPGRL